LAIKFAIGREKIPSNLGSIIGEENTLGGYFPTDGVQYILRHIKNIYHAYFLIPA
jgi:hypothetical protein